MKTLTAAITMALFATTAGADNIYHGLADGNSDLFDQHEPAERIAGVQPGVGDSVDLYWGLADGNPDLFKRGAGDGTGSDDPRVYEGFGGNPDLSY